MDGEKALNPSPLMLKGLDPRSLPLLSLPTAVYDAVTDEVGTGGQVRDPGAVLGKKVEGVAVAHREFDLSPDVDTVVQ